MLIRVPEHIVIFAVPNQLVRAVNIRQTIVFQDFFFFLVVFALEQDLCTWDRQENAFDVVTLLEVLEHIPDVQAAVNAAVRLARRYVVVSVPSQPDDNPEHIHFLTKPVLTGLFQNAGCRKLHFSGVNGHLILLVSVT